MNISNNLYREDLIALHCGEPVLKDCIWSVVEQYPDGYIWCSLVDNMGCEECYKILERRMDDD